MSSDDSDIEENLRNLKLDDKDINILLLGETGVGKSTFINAFANYLSQKYFDNAENNGLVVLIPSVFKIADKKGKIREVKVGPEKDKNEVLETGESATQDVKTYVFPVWRGRANVRLIDTPGMGDTRGIEQDEKNCDYILRYLKTLKKIHAICFLFKPTEARKTVFFEYCLYQMMSRLDKTACKNIFCLFTNTRGSDYGPGDTFVNLKSFVKHLQAKTTGVVIDIDKNKFCFDNEAFKFLAAIEKKVKFDDSMRGVNLKSWQESAKQCWGFIRHLQKETAPYSTENLFLVNTSRRIMLQLSKVLADIKQLIDDNETIIERLQINKNLEEFDIQELKRKQKSEVTNVERIQVSDNVLVCTSRTCAEVYRVNGMHKWHYKKFCHRPCNETSNYAKDTIGCPQLVNCVVINKSTRCCRECGCDFSVHMHVNYITKLSESTVWDEDMCSRIATRESLVDNSKEIINDICMKNNELNSEHETIQKLMYQIARFLQNNAIIASSDSYKQYIVYLINQKQTLGTSGTNSSIQDLKRLLQEYEETEKVFHQALRTPLSSSDSYFDSQGLMKNLKKLFTLTQNSKKIKQIYDKLKESENIAPPRVKEYVHKKCYENEDEQKNKARGYGHQNDKKDRNSNENFSQKQRDRRGLEKQKDYDSKNRNQPRRDVSRGRTDHRGRFNEERNRHTDPRNQHDPRMLPPPYPQGAHGRYQEPLHYAMGYERDPRHQQDPRMAPLPYHQGAHGGYAEPRHYPTTNVRGPNYQTGGNGNHDKYNLNVTVQARPAREAYIPGNLYDHPPQQAPYRPEHAPFPPPVGQYPPQFGAYPPQHPNIPPLMQGAYNAPRPGNREDNQEGRRNYDRRTRGGHRGGKGKDGKQTFKPSNRKPKNKNKKDDSDDDSDGSDASSTS